MASVPATSPASPANSSTPELTPAPANPSQIPADVRMPSLASGMCGRIHPKTLIAALQPTRLPLLPAAGNLFMARQSSRYRVITVCLPKSPPRRHVRQGRGKAAG